MSIITNSPISPDLSDSSANEPMFFVVSIRKLIFMSIFTFGAYWAFCHYRNWALYRQASAERVLPLARAFFGVFFLYSLLRRVDRQIQLTGRSYEWSPIWLVVVYILMTALGIWANHLIEMAQSAGWGSLMAANVVWFCVLAKMQMAINFCVGDSKGESNSRFSLLNWLWMSFGILFWTVILVTFLTLLGVPMGI